MKITHRVIAAGMVAVAAVSLAACSSSSTESSSDGTPSGTVSGIFDKQYQAALDPIVQDFEKKYPNVKVDINYQGGDLGAVVLTQIQAGTAPDVLLTFPGGDPKASSDNVLPLAAQGRILPITADWSKDIPSVWASQVEAGGKLYAFPGALQPLSAIYNKTLMDKLGLKVPTTLDEVYQLCTAAKTNGVYAYAQGLGDTAAGPQMLSFGQTAPLVYGAEPTWDQGLSTGKVTYTNSGWQDQFVIYQKMFNDGCFGDGALGRSRQQGQDALAQRQALGVVDVGAVLAGIKATNKNDNFVFAAIPATNDGKNAITALPGYTLTVNAKAKNPTAAQAFVAFAGEAAESAKFADGFGSVPLVPNPQFTAPDALKDFQKLVQSGKAAPLANVTPQVQVALNTGVQSMLLGNDTPKSLAQKLQDAYGK